MSDRVAPVMAGPRRSIRRRRWVVGLVVVLGLLVGADRIAVALAERAAADTFQSSQHLTSRPSVSIGGFPFLTQLAAGTLDRVRVAARDIVVGSNGRTVRIAGLTAHLHRVHISRSLNSARAETADATALINYPDLSQTLGVTVSYAGVGSDGRGRVKATRSVSVAGQQITGSVSAAVNISPDNVLSFVSPQVDVNGAALPPAVVDALQAAFAAPIPLVRLPFGLVVRSVTASPAGVTIALDGTNLRYGSG
ncbi:MAG: hypothetical protein JWO57_4342 [Pseudonocardiales bacterium]|nr:hypothetical protein [Pseudonocardiales bacterium]